MPEEPTFNSDLQVEATAYATHPEGAVLPGDEPADRSDIEEEN